MLTLKNHDTPLDAPPVPPQPKCRIFPGHATAGGTLAALLGPASPSERRRGLARLVWLMAVVMLPKGFTVMYGLLNPGASMGEAANVMLPRHVAIVMWLAFAFPVRDRKKWRKRGRRAGWVVA